jgi:hypothetical protein
MANPERGEVDLEVNGRRYRLALGLGGLRTIQRVVSTPTHRVTLPEVVHGAFNGDIDYLCVMVWGALQRYHPEMTQASVEDLLDEFGGLTAIPKVHALLNEMMAATTPDARDAAVLKKTDPTARPGIVPPLEATGTTGTGSTSRRAKSA